MMEPMTSSERNATLLLVEDETLNANLVRSYLERDGHQVKTANTGEEALKIAAKTVPELILLDVMMPQMDGFECCQRLKANPKTQDIPVIFMTALTEVSDKVKGFEIGAVDYITKPIQPEELQARVNTHLEIRRLQAFQKQQTQSLQEKNRELEAQYKELNTFSQCMTADLKKPLSSMTAFLRVIAKDLQAHGNPQSLHFFKEIEQARAKMADVVDNLLLLANIRTRRVTLERLNMVSLLANVRKRLQPLIDEKKAELNMPSTWPEVWGHGPWVEKIWEVYLSNGLRYGGKPPKLELGAAREDDGQVRFWVRDNGPGLSPEELNLLGDGRVELLMGEDGPEVARVKEGYGLELSVAQRVAEKLGGYVGVESAPNKGNVFSFTLPAAQGK